MSKGSLAPNSCEGNPDVDSDIYKVFSVLSDDEFGVSDIESETYDVFPSLAPETEPGVPDPSLKNSTLHYQQSYLKPEELVVFMDNLDFARNVARKRVGGYELDDIEQSAAIGLMKAVHDFDPQLGVPFDGYAAARMRWEINRFKRDLTWNVRVHRSAKEDFLRLEEAIRTNLDKDIKTDSGNFDVDKLAAKSGLTPEQTRDALILRRDRYQPTSLNATYSDGELVNDIEASGFSSSEITHRVIATQVLKRMGEKYLRAMDLYQAGFTQEEIAAELGVNQMYVSRMLKKARAEIREAAKD